jgi:F0F1-type ATP synthase membrane subunit b/b'
MDLLNQTLNSFSIQFFDIETVFDANLVNLILLDGGLFYLLSSALSESLLERQKKVLLTIQESEEKLEDATARLIESESRLSEAPIVIASIQAGAEETSTKLRASILREGQVEIMRLSANAEARRLSFESQVRKTISDKIARKILNQVTTRIEKITGIDQYRTRQLMKSYEDSKNDKAGAERFFEAELFGAQKTLQKLIIDSKIGFLATELSVDPNMVSLEKILNNKRAYLSKATNKDLNSLLNSVEVSLFP